MEGIGIALDVPRRSDVHDRFWRLDLFRQQVKAYDAVLFVTPEYNRSVPAPLKNAIDVGSRPFGQSVWDRKPGAVVSASPGSVGGFGANHHLRQSLVFLNVPCLQMPEAYIGGIENKFDEKGALSDNSTREFLQNFMNAYAEWVERNGMTRTESLNPLDSRAWLATV